MQDHAGYRGRYQTAGVLVDVYPSGMIGKFPGGVIRLVVYTHAVNKIGSGISRAVYADRDIRPRRGIDGADVNCASGRKVGCENIAVGVNLKNADV